MRRLKVAGGILIVLILAGMGVFHFGSHGSDETELKRNRSRLVKEMERDAVATGVNVPYRRALMEAGRPMGYVAMCGGYISKWESDLARSRVRVSVRAVLPRSTPSRGGVKVLFDDLMVLPCDITIEGENEPGDIGCEMLLYFETDAERLLKSEKVSIEIDGARDLLVTCTPYFNSMFVDMRQAMHSSGDGPWPFEHRVGF